MHTFACINSCSVAFLPLFFCVRSCYSLPCRLFFFPLNSSCERWSFRFYVCPCRVVFSMQTAISSCSSAVYAVFLFFSSSSFMRLRRFVSSNRSDGFSAIFQKWLSESFKIVCVGCSFSWLNWSGPIFCAFGKMKFGVVFVLFFFVFFSILALIKLYIILHTFTHHVTLHMNRFGQKWKKRRIKRKIIEYERWMRS